MRMVSRRREQNFKGNQGWIFCAWMGIVEFFTETIPNAWNEMLSSLLANPTIRTIVTTITDSFTKLKENLNGIWNGIKQLAQNAWEFTKTLHLHQYY